ncbi:mRNA splicing protein prp28 [Paramarasmius palmivorus]|uniref:mRNA splicing protein prp28 n=1 Tax=Paramarasmius palmivorus TaxID=297713 RepID=A0AAW0E929_9AGAR
MTVKLDFRSSEGLKVIDSIVKKRIPQWKDGLKPHQREPIAEILDLMQVMYITGTGDGKSALFIVPILVHLEISQNTRKYPQFNVPIKKKPVGIVIAPTKGLANNIVKESAKFGIKAFAFTQQNISAAR